MNTEAHTPALPDGTDPQKAPLQQAMGRLEEFDLGPTDREFQELAAERAREIVDDQERTARMDEMERWSEAQGAIAERSAQLHSQARKGYRELFEQAVASGDTARLEQLRESAKNTTPELKNDSSVGLEVTVDKYDVDPESPDREPVITTVDKVRLSPRHSSSSSKSGPTAIAATDKKDGYDVTTRPRITVLRSPKQISDDMQTDKNQEGAQD